MSNQIDTASLIWGLLVLMMVGSSLLSMRLPMKQAAKMAMGWVGIAAIAFAIFSFREDLRPLWQRLTRDFGDKEVSGSGGIVRLRRDDSGHYFARAQVNGRDVVLLVDTGATYTTFPEAMARDLGIIVDKSGFPTLSSTANGTVTDWRARVESLAVGNIVRNDLPVRVTEGALEEPLLGMNWLSTLKGWRMEKGELVLEP
jgi:aspartyl protease family protein